MTNEYNLNTKNIRNTLSFWKNSILPANLSTLHQKIINHNLKLKAQAKHWIKNTNTKEEIGRCTFCSLTRTRTNGAYEQETYKDFFLECNTTVAIINYAKETYKEMENL